VDDVVAAKQAGGAASGTLAELTLAEFITSGGYDRQVRLARLAYRRRRDRLAAALRQHAPRVRVTGIAAGLHALLELPPDLPEAEVTRRAADRGLSVDGLAGYRAEPGTSGPAGGAPGGTVSGRAAGDGTGTDRAAGDGMGTGTRAGAGTTGDRGPALVVGYARPPAHAFTTALARLCAVLADPGG
jgi:GntR family transcriptional regulator/MocR family aminotransferase